MSNQLQYALRNNFLTHISDVESGLACNCYCPSCGSRLVAKKGQINQHHFSHYNSEECSAGYETSLHLAAEDIISKHKEIIIPAVYLNFPHSYKESEKLFEPQIMKVDNVYLEKRIDDIIPDIIIESSGERFFIEIFVTHKVDDEKLLKIRKLGISAIEIDLSEVSFNIAREEFERLIIEDIEHKKWLFNVTEDKYYNEFEKRARSFTKAKIGNGNHCPLNKYMWEGISSARWVDCIYCEFCLSAQEPPNCLGEALVSKVEDLEKTKWQLENKYGVQLEEEEIRLRKKGYCPKCKNGRLIKREGPYGVFLGCNNFPSCKYTYRA